MSMNAAVVPSLVQTMQPLHQTQKDSPARIRKSASDFEALLIGQMLRSAREAGGGGLTGSGDDENEANSVLVEMGEQQFAQALASKGGLGIANMVVAGLTKNADR